MQSGLLTPLWPRMTEAVMLRVMLPRIHFPCLRDFIRADVSPTAVGPLPLDEANAHHLLRVLRRSPGDAVEVFDGDGQAFLAVLEAGKPAAISLREQLPVEPAPALQLGLAQCLSAAEKMDWTIEKAVELGATHIVPLLSARSVVKLDASRAEKRLQHWQRLVVAAAMQCGRNRLPEILPVQPLRQWLGTLPAPAADEHRWVLHPEGGASLAAQAHAVRDAAAPHAPDSEGRPQPRVNPAAVAGQDDEAGRPATPAADTALPEQPEGTAGKDGTVTRPTAGMAWLLCGPESGLAPEELALARNQGWQPALLGPRVLRTETAGLVGLSVLQTVLGDLG
ncbi:MAG: RsmE family RNA methyltransferase [Lautropia sp.]|nr:RsmE family RNA methyltransferase [Lautropia sp.]